MSELMPKVKVFLDSANAEYEVMACDPSLADTKQFCDHYNILILGGGNRASKLKLDPATLNNIAALEVVPELAHPIPTDS